MSDGIAFRAAGVRLKKVRGSGLRCVTGHSFIHVFLFGPVKPLENLGSLRGKNERLDKIVFYVLF